MRRDVVLLQSDHPSLLVTWGLLRPTVMLPAGAADWPDERARIVLHHELEHIRRGDWIIQVLGEVLRAVHWFNPLVWIACDRLRRESEHACDDAVLRAGIDGTDYAAQLLELARALNAGRQMHLPAPAMARSSSLEGRISAMLNARLNRTPLTRSMRIATAFLLLCLTVSIAGVAAQRFSKFTGTLLDQTNGFLPNVAVTLTNKDSGAKHEVRSDRTGHFEFVGLPDGEYVLAAAEAGFAPMSEPITIAGRDIDRAIQLQVGLLHETITVTGDGGARQAPRDPEKQQQYRQWAQDKRREIAERCAPSGGAGALGGNILQPSKVTDVRPRYPESARGGGVLTFDALIGTDGTIRDVRVVSGGDPDLERAAIDAVRQWEFSTTFLNCTPIEVRMQVTVTFAAQ